MVIQRSAVFGTVMPSFFAHGFTWSVPVDSHFGIANFTADRKMFNAWRKNTVLISTDSDGNKSVINEWRE